MKGRRACGAGRRGEREGGRGGRAFALDRAGRSAHAAPRPRPPAAGRRRREAVAATGTLRARPLSVRPAGPGPSCAARGVLDAGRDAGGAVQQPRGPGAGRPGGRRGAGLRRPHPHRGRAPAGPTARARRPPPPPPPPTPPRPLAWTGGRAVAPRGPAVSRGAAGPQNLLLTAPRCGRGEHAVRTCLFCGDLLEKHVASCFLPCLPWCLVFVSLTNQRAHCQPLFILWVGFSAPVYRAGA